MKTWVTKNGYRITRVLSGRSNVFLVSYNNLNILVDTSTSRYRKKIKERLHTLGLHHIDYLVLTHSHFDHAGNAREIKENFSAKVFIHNSEAAYLENGDNIIPNGTNFFTRPLLKAFAPKIFPKLKFEPCKCDLTVGEVFLFFDLGLNARIIHTPGHTPGSMSMVVDDEIALVGDTMFGVFKNSIMTPVAKDVITMIDSWGLLLNTGCRLFLPGHGTENSRALVEKCFNKQMQHQPL